MADQVGDHLAQVEAAIESVAEGAEVVAGVFGELEGLVGPADHGLEVAQNGVDPGEQRQVTRLAIGHDDVGVRAAGGDDAGKAVQAIAAHIASRRQMHTSPVGDGLGGEAWECAELDAQGMAGVAGGDGGHEGHLVGRAPTANARTLAAEVGVIELDHARQRCLAVAQGHGMHQLVMDQPGGAVGGAQMAHQGQGRQPSLGLADQVHRQEPGPQGQLGAVHQGARRQRGLVSAGSALVELARAMPDDVVIGPVATRAAKALGPALRGQRRCALRFAAVAGEELGHGHPGLKLHSVHRHRWLPFNDGAQLRHPQAHQMSLAEVRDESGGFIWVVDEPELVAWGSRRTPSWLSKRLAPISTAFYWFGRLCPIASLKQLVSEGAPHGSYSVALS